MYPILTVTTFLPLVGAIAVLLLSERWARGIALGTTLATLFVSVPLYPNFDKTSSALQFVEVWPWIPSWNVTYGMGVDGISLPFIFLSVLMSVLCVSASWTAVQKRLCEFYAALLVAETAMIGLFAATNLFLFFVFLGAHDCPHLSSHWCVGGRESCLCCPEISVVYLGW